MFPCLCLNVRMELWVGQLNILLCLYAGDFSIYACEHYIYSHWSCFLICFSRCMLDETQALEHLPFSFDSFFIDFTIIVSIRLLKLLIVMKLNASRRHRERIRSNSFKALATKHAIG